MNRATSHNSNRNKKLQLRKKNRHQARLQKRRAQKEKDIASVLSTPTLQRECIKQFGAAKKKRVSVTNTLADDSDFEIINCKQSQSMCIIS